MYIQQIELLITSHIKFNCSFAFYDDREPKYN